MNNPSRNSLVVYDVIGIDSEAEVVAGVEKDAAFLVGLREKGTCTEGKRHDISHALCYRGCCGGGGRILAVTSGRTIIHRIKLAGRAADDAVAPRLSSAIPGVVSNNSSIGIRAARLRGVRVGYCAARSVCGGGRSVHSNRGGVKGCCERDS